MPVAFVLVCADVGRIDEVLTKILEIEEVTEAYSVAGPYAIVAKIESKKFEDLAMLIPERFHSIQGVTGTLTLLAFGLSREFRLEACGDARALAEAGKMKELYSLCRNCKQLKLCGFGARVITFGF